MHIAYMRLHWGNASMNEAKWTIPRPTGHIRGFHERGAEGSGSEVGIGAGDTDYQVLKLC